VCIKQENVVERNHQVALMQEIYGKAQAVHAWLGEARGNSDVFDFIFKGLSDQSLRSL
jgi:hypothetical protein